MTCLIFRFSQRKKEKEREKEKEDSPPLSSSLYRRTRESSPYTFKTEREKSPLTSSITQRTYGGRSNYSLGEDDTDTNPRYGNNSRYSSYVSTKYSQGFLCANEKV